MTIAAGKPPQDSPFSTGWGPILIPRWKKFVALEGLVPWERIG
jgi:hypothetical protein